MSSTQYPPTGDQIARAVLCSQVLSGCQVSSNEPGSSTFNIAPGVVQIVSELNNITTVNRLAYNGENNITPTQPTGTNFLYITPELTIVQSSTLNTYADFNTNIFIGAINTNGGVIIDAISEGNVTNVNIPATLAELQRAMRPWKNYGMNLTDSGNTDLEPRVTEGEFWSLGSFVVIDPDSPNRLPWPDTTFPTVIYTNRNLTTINVGAAIDPTLWDNAGTVQALANNNRWSVQRVYLNSGGTLIVQYGQAEYTTLGAALVGVTTEPFDKPSTLDTILLAGYLVMKKNCTDLSNTASCIIIQPPQINGENNVTLI